MFEILEKWTGDGVVALRVSGKLLHEDYQGFVPKLEEAIAKYGAIRCLIDLTELDGIELRAVWDELRFDLKHATDVSCCAVVGDRAWERWATMAARPIFRKAEVRFFERVDLEQAADWVREGST
jgi:universal stress protein A